MAGSVRRKRARPARLRDGIHTKAYAGYLKKGWLQFVLYVSSLGVALELLLRASARQVDGWLSDYLDEQFNQRRSFYQAVCVVLAVQRRLRLKGKLQWAWESIQVWKAQAYSETKTHYMGDAFVCSDGAAGQGWPMSKSRTR